MKVINVTNTQIIVQRVWVDNKKFTVHQDKVRLLKASKDDLLQKLNLLYLMSQKANIKDLASPSQRDQDSPNPRRLRINDVSVPGARMRRGTKMSSRLLHSQLVLYPLTLLAQGTVPKWLYSFWRTRGSDLAVKEGLALIRSPASFILVQKVGCHCESIFFCVCLLKI